MKALVIGATGATGKEILELLLKDSNYQEVAIFVRREVELQHEKLKVHVIDFDAPKTWSHLVTGDVLFSCLGTTLDAAGSKAAQWEIDYGYQYAFAKNARHNQMPHYVLVSSSKASADSFFFYSKMKGKLEDAVKALSFSKLIIFRPPILEREDSERTMEVIGVKVLRFFNKLGLLKSQKPMKTTVLAKAMVHSVTVLEPGEHVLESQDILELVVSN
jgi:uncharacterized protein YbjT (DUF2867 family)